MTGLMNIYKNKIHKNEFCKTIIFTFVTEIEVENRKNTSVYIMEYVEIKDRIAHIIRAKNLTAAEFALRLGVQPSNVSHLIAGRNNPSLEFVKKLKETFPEYNLDWIVLGKGPMTVSEPLIEQRATAVPVDSLVEEVSTVDASMERALFDAVASPMVSEPSLPAASSGLKQVIMVFEDNRFEVLLPR